MMKLIEATEALCVYEFDNPKQYFADRDGDGSLILADAEESTDGTWSLVLENRRGTFYLMAWSGDDMHNEPSITLRLGESFNLPGAIEIA